MKREKKNFDIFSSNDNAKININKAFLEYNLASNKINKINFYNKN